MSRTASTPLLDENAQAVWTRGVGETLDERVVEAMDGDGAVVSLERLHDQLLDCGSLDLDEQLRASLHQRADLAQGGNLLGAGRLLPQVRE